MRLTWLYHWKNWGTEQLTNIFKSAHPVKLRTGLWSQTVRSRVYVFNSKVFSLRTCQELAPFLIMSLIRQARAPGALGISRSVRESWPPVGEQQTEPRRGHLGFCWVDQIQRQDPLNEGAKVQSSSPWWSQVKGAHLKPITISGVQGETKCWRWTLS